MQKCAALLILSAAAALTAIPASAQTEPALFKQRVVGGNRADIKQHPWQVALNIRTTHGDRLCGGSIVEPLWVLTAAHCFTSGPTKPGDVRARAGATNYRAPGPWLEVERVVAHEGYDPLTFENDIALLKLKSSPLPAGGQAIRLAVKSVAMPSGQPLDITGWGATKEGGSGSTVLMKATVPLVDLATCNAKDAYAGKVKSSMLCAGVRSGGIDSCQGDSGGPLVWRTLEGPVLVGVVSHGEGCARKLKYGVYTGVGGHRDWIDSVLALDRRQRPEQLSIGR